jgi:hypothetical protein
VIDYETYCKIKDCHGRQRLTVAQTARALGLHAETVAKWVRCAQYRARQAPPRSSRLDPFKARIVRLLESYPYSAQQIYQRLREEGFAGGFTIVKDYVRTVRPPRREAFLKLAFAAGECAQLDWGAFGSIGVGSVMSAVAIPSSESAVYRWSSVMVLAMACGPDLLPLASGGAAIVASSWWPAWCESRHVTETVPPAIAGFQVSANPWAVMESVIDFTRACAAVSSISPSMMTMSS